jgi:hypothetical protein
MKKNFKLSAILLCLILVGCMETGQQQLTVNESYKNPVASNESDPNARKGPGGGTNSDVNLSVTVEDYWRISHDGKGPYKDGIDRVTAKFLASDGTLSFITSPTNVKTAIRSLTFPNQEYAINLNASFSYIINILAPLDITDFKRIQDFEVGESHLMGMRVFGINSKGFTDFRLLFNIGSGAGYVTDEVRVIRIDSTTWTVESIRDSRAALTGSDNKDLKDYYSVPFKLTLRKI